MDLLHLEAAIAFPNFLDTRQELVRILMRREPWESEGFIGEQNFYNFVRRVFGRNAAVANFIFTVFYLLMALYYWPAFKKSIFIMIFQQLSCSTWLIFAVTWIFMYHHDQLSDTSFDLSGESTIHDIMENNREIQTLLQETNGRESSNRVIRRMLTKHTVKMYTMVMIWLMINFILAMPVVVERISLVNGLLTFVCMCFVQLFLEKQATKVLQQI